jgi:hypothetical protein
MNPRSLCSETLTWKPTKRLSVLSRKCADIALVRVQEHDEELRSGFEKASYTRTALSCAAACGSRKPIGRGSRSKPDMSRTWHQRCASNMLNDNGKMALWLLTTQWTGKTGALSVRKMASSNRKVELLCTMCTVVPSRKSQPTFQRHQRGSSCYSPSRLRRSGWARVGSTRRTRPVSCSPIGRGRQHQGLDPCGVSGEASAGERIRQPLSREKKIVPSACVFRITKGACGNSTARVRSRRETGPSSRSPMYSPRFRTLERK